MSNPLIANLICGSPHRNHDFDFARLRLGQAIYDANNIRTDAFQDYEDSAAILGGDLLVSYTSRVPVSDNACMALKRYLERGGRWFAMHASNSVLDNKHLPDILGSRFHSHPPFQRFHVDVVKPNDSLLAGIGSFDIDDELFCIDIVKNDVEVLLQSRWGGGGYGNTVYEVEDRPLMYKRRVGDGAVLYLGLGHANRPYDKPYADRPDQPDHRGPWDTPVFKTLIERAIAWAAHRMD
jgi:type 1 glutamine amidotransferase